LKTPYDPRHLSRQKTIQALFEWSFRNLKSPQVGKNILLKKNKKALEIIENLETINQIIEESAPEWPIEKISKIDLTILQLAIYELVIEKKTPIKVIIDEAVELAKEFGGETSSRFVNGALGKAVKKIIA